MVVFIVALSIDAFSYSAYRAEVKRPVERAYWRGVGVYSFLEWWLLYGSFMNVLEFFYSRIFLHFLNPSITIASNGQKISFARFSTGQGRFWGNGDAGKW